VAWLAVGQVPILLDDAVAQRDPQHVRPCLDGVAVRIIAGLCRMEVGLHRLHQTGDRLQHLRGALPCAIRVTGAAHPLRGRTLDAVSFMHLRGVLYLVVRLPDSSPGTIPASATDIFGVAAAPGPAMVLDADGLRRLRALVTALAAGVGRAR